MLGREVYSEPLALRGTDTYSFTNTDSTTKALQKKDEGVSKDKNQLLDEYERAVRANHQLAVTLQGQGLN